MTALLPAHQGIRVSYYSSMHLLWDVLATRGQVHGVHDYLLPCLPVTLRPYTHLKSLSYCSAVPTPSTHMHMHAILCPSPPCLHALCPLLTSLLPPTHTHPCKVCRCCWL
jgi:hypothetical protein